MYSLINYVFKIKLKKYQFIIFFINIKLEK